MTLATLVQGIQPYQEYCVYSRSRSNDTAAESARPAPVAVG